MPHDVGVKTILDVGCGLGLSTDYFLRQGMEARCLEGSTEALRGQAWSPYLQKYKPTALHDFSVGPPQTLPETFFDMAWSAEFLEHIERKYVVNVMAAFSRAHLVFVTYGEPGQGGFHHVNLQRAPWWIKKFEEYDFEYLEEFTKLAKLFTKQTSPVREWANSRVCSYKGFEWVSRNCGIALSWPGAYSVLYLAGRTTAAGA